MGSSRNFILDTETLMPYKDKDDQLANQRRHYANHKERVAAKTRRHRIKKKAAWVAFKKTLSCTKCGENHPATLDFHHVIKDPSNKKINKLISQNAWAVIPAELAKCVVLCANCHRIHHHDELMGERKARKKKKKKMLAQDTHTHYHTHKPDKGADNGQSTK
jgi:hypothetical protein